MFVADGNNSLKRQRTLGNRSTADLRVFEDSDYFLSNEFVDSFAHEVKSRRDVRKAEDLSDDEDELEIISINEEGDPTDGTSGTSACSRNWKAAAADSKKKMWSIFEETGVFALCCRHGFILWLCDMRRSGELYIVLF